MPLDFTYARRSGQEVVTIFMPGEEPRVCDSAHPHFAEVKAALQDPQHKGLTDQQLFDLADVEKGIAQRFERLSERVTVRDRTVYFDGDPVDNSLTKQMLRVMGDNGDLSALVCFYEKVMTNPLEHSREHLYRWVDRNHITIVSEGEHKGDIIGYKGGRIGYDGVIQSTTSGRAIVNGEVIEGPIPYPIGAIVEMPRSSVAHKPSAPCDTGLHVGTYDFAKGFSQGLIEVRINPRDVVNVPEANKIRVCRLTVLGPCNEEIRRSTAAVVTPPAPKAVKPVEETDHVPTDGEWDEMWARAKKRRQNFKKYASTTGGWKFVGSDDDNFKDRNFWTVPAVEPPVEEPQEAAESVSEPRGRAHLIDEDKYAIVGEAQDRGIDWEPTWVDVEEDDPTDVRAVADFGLWEVSVAEGTATASFGEVGRLTAEVVGAKMFNNERVAFFFTPEGFEGGEEVVPGEQLEPVSDATVSHDAIVPDPVVADELAQIEDDDSEDQAAEVAELEAEAREAAMYAGPDEPFFEGADSAESVTEASAFEAPEPNVNERVPRSGEYLGMLARSKTRRQNFRKYASTTGGWIYVGPEDGDGKSRDHWVIREH